MSIFDLRQSVVDEYSKYVQSFLSIADERVRSFIEESLLRNHRLLRRKLPLLKEKEKKQYGEYRTRRSVLEAWDRLEAG
jgi:hypothetical protein